MNMDYLYKNWAQIGMVSAIFIFVLLFFNTYVPIGSYQWLLWLNIPFYFIHQFEEYVYPGGFLEDMNKNLEGLGNGNVKLTERDAFYINVLFTWILMPLFNILGFISILFPLIVLATATVNPLLHIFGTIRARKYAPGLIAGLVLNLPLGLYVFIGISLSSMITIFQLIIVILIGIGIHMSVLVPILSKWRA